MCQLLNYESGKSDTPLFIYAIRKIDWGVALAVEHLYSNTKNCEKFKSYIETSDLVDKMTLLKAGCQLTK